MRKILAFIVSLSCIVAANGFAQWSTRLHFDFNPQLFNSITPTGLYAQKYITDDAGDRRLNTGTTHLERTSIIPGNAGRYFPKGSYSFFTPQLIPGKDAYNSYIDGHLFLSYNEGLISSNITINYVDVVRNFPRMAGGTNQYTIFRDIFDYLFIEDVEFRLNHRLLSFYAGTSGGSDIVVPYSDLSRMTVFPEVSMFGIMVPGGDYLYRPVYNRFRFWANPANIPALPMELFNIVGTLKFLDVLYAIPIIVDVAAGLDTMQIVAGSDLSQIRLGGGAAVRGKGIAGLFDFDLIYKVRGGDPTLDDSWTDDPNIHDGDLGGFQPDGEGAWVHYLSLALGLPTTIPNWGISFAYNVMFPVYEDDATNTMPGAAATPYTITKKGPVYNGIDLRLQYTGIPSMRIILANNVTFANAGEPTVNSEGIITGNSVNMFTSANLYKNYSQKWFALYNALAVRYTISRNLVADLEMVHRMSVATELNSDPDAAGNLADWGKNQKIGNILQSTAFITFNLGGLTYLQAGASLWVENRKTTYSGYVQENFSGRTSWEGGAVGFSIPVRLAIYY